MQNPHFSRLSFSSFSQEFTELEGAGEFASHVECFRHRESVAESSCFQTTEEDILPAAEHTVDLSEDPLGLTSGNNHKFMEISNGLKSKKRVLRIADGSGH